MLSPKWHPLCFPLATAHGFSALPWPHPSHILAVLHQVLCLVCFPLAGVLLCEWEEGFLHVVVCDLL